MTWPNAQPGKAGEICSSLRRAWLPGLKWPTGRPPGHRTRRGPSPWQRAPNLRLTIPRGYRRPGAARCGRRYHGHRDRLDQRSVSSGGGSGLRGRRRVRHRCHAVPEIDVPRLLRPSALNLRLMRRCTVCADVRDSCFSPLGVAGRLPHGPPGERSTCPAIL
jgi:hypothetical protein